LILIPYFAYGELELALGKARLRQILFASRAGHSGGGQVAPEPDGPVLPE
jgi:hypothetical protein